MDTYVTSKGATDPVVIYIATAEADVVHLMVDCCRQYTHSQGHPVHSVITDDDRKQPLSQRLGWKRLLGLIAGSEVGGVVTYSYGMVAPSGMAYDSLARHLGSRGAFIACARLPAPVWSTSPQCAASETASCQTAGGVE